MREGATLPPCPLCGEPLDPHGDHFVTCGKNGLTRRHNAVRDAWANLLAKANIPHGVEVSSGGAVRPADVLLVAWDKGRDMAVDFRVSSPLTLDCYPLSLHKAKRHLHVAEGEKIAENEPRCSAVGWGCHAVAYSPWGGQGPGAKALLHEVMRRATADLEGWPKAAKIAEHTQAISLALAREVARQLRVRCRVTGD